MGISTGAKGQRPMRQRFPHSSILAALIICSFWGSTSSAQDKAPGTSISHEERMAWFRHDKFGMFIHWGPYSLLAGEWKGQRIPVGTEAEDRKSTRLNSSHVRISYAVFC